MKNGGKQGARTWGLIVDYIIEDYSNRMKFGQKKKKKGAVIAPIPHNIEANASGHFCDGVDRWSKKIKSLIFDLLGEFHIIGPMLIGHDSGGTGVDKHHIVTLVEEVVVKSCKYAKGHLTHSLIIHAGL